MGWGWHSASSLCLGHPTQASSFCLEWPSHIASSVRSQAVSPWDLTETSPGRDQGAGGEAGPCKGTTLLKAFFEKLIFCS